MDKIRIGNDIAIRWGILAGINGNESPYNLEGKNLTLYLQNVNGEALMVPLFSTHGNVIEFTYHGKDQKQLGAYSLILVENEDLPDMHTVDMCKAFSLVGCTCQEDKGDSDEVECVYLEFSSTINVVNVSGGNSPSITIDSELSNTSGNPLQNRVITSEFAKQQASINNVATKVNVLNGNGEGSVNKKILDAINAFATQLTDDGIVNTYAEALNYIATHGGEFTALVGKVSKNADNIKKNAEDIEDINSHIGDPDDAADKDGSIYARIANLVAIVSESTGGSTESVEAQINAAIKAIVGTLSDDDAKTLEAINDELDKLQEQINNLPGEEVEFEQVQSDWNETDTSKPSYIKNKPTIPSSAVVDSALSTTSTNAVQNKIITNELNKKQATIADLETIRSGATKGATAVQPIEGKGLSTEDFTTALKNKLDALKNYDDTTLTAAIESLRQEFNTLVSGDTSTAIDNYNNIIAFLSGIEDSQKLDSIIASIEQQIATKQATIADLETIRQGAAKGMTAIQEHQSLTNYATKTYVSEAIASAITTTLNTAV